jgi:hypothetical protein
VQAFQQKPETVQSRHVLVLAVAFLVLVTPIKVILEIPNKQKILLMEQA